MARLYKDGLYNLHINTVQRDVQTQTGTGISWAGDSHSERDKQHERFQTFCYLLVNLSFFLSFFTCRSQIAWKKNNTSWTWRLRCSAAGSFFCSSVQLFPCVYPLTSPCMWTGQSVTSVWPSTRPSAWDSATRGYVQYVLQGEEWYRQSFILMVVKAPWNSDRQGAKSC